MRIGIGLALALGVLLGTAGISRAQESPPLEDRIFRAFYQENGVRDFPKAAALYAEAADAARAAKDDAALLRALLGSGRCLLKTGHTEEAKAAFRAALDLDPACDEAAQGILAAEGRPDDIERELKDRITALVWKLGGPEREQAAADLKRIGARAVPFLEEGLRTADIGIVGNAAAILATLQAPGARGALARALVDSRVAFPETLRAYVGSIPPSGRDPDVSGRLALLRVVVGMAEPERGPVLRVLLRQGFSHEPADEVAPVVLGLLRGADDGTKTLLLGTHWGEASKAIRPVALECLRSGDADLRRVALIACGWGGDLSPEAVTALKAVMAHGETGDRLGAFRLLARGESLGRAERLSAVAGFLTGGDPESVRGILDWLAPQDQAVPERTWQPEFAPAFMDGIRRILSGVGQPDNKTLYGFHRVLFVAREDLAEEDLVDIAVRCAARPPVDVVKNLAIAAMDLVVARHPGTGPVEDTRVFDLGLAGLGETALGPDWVSRWNYTRLDPAAILRMGACRTQPMVRQYAWNWLVRWTPAAWSPFPEAAVANLAEDLLSPNTSLAATAYKIAVARPDPGLAAAVRGLVARPNDQNSRKAYLRLLVACAGKDAEPDLRRWLEEKPDSDVLEMLVSVLGEEAVPDLRKFLVEHASLYARDHLVRFLGKGAVPELVKAALAFAEKHPDAPFESRMILGANARWDSDPSPDTLAVSHELAAAFFEAFPQDRRTGALFRQCSFSLSDDQRERWVEAFLSDTRPDLVAAAAWVVRRFNMAGYWPRLLPLLDHPDEGVREEAQEALDSIRKARELRESFERYGTDTTKKVLDDAAVLVKDPDPVKRRGAALALGALGDPSGVPLLLTLLDDPDPAVRESALSALEKLGGK